MKYIAVDFDGTLVSHNFPEIGAPAPHVEEVTKRLQDLGFRFILNTMRGSNQCLNPITNKLVSSKVDPELPTVLDDAVNWCEEHDIKLYGINKNPSQRSWTNSPKVYAHFYVDDMAVGAPMTVAEDGKPAIDWLKIEEIIINKLKNGEEGL